MTGWEPSRPAYFELEDPAQWRVAREKVRSR